MSQITPGFTIGKNEPNMSGAIQNQLFFEDAIVPVENVLIREDGFRKMMMAFNAERCGNATMSLLTARCAFEKALAPWFGSQNVLALNSGTSALHLALRLADVGYGDEVISTAMTCTATNVPILAMGASEPWPEAMEALTGQRQMDATAILDYFAPLQLWLDEQNAERNCGW